MLSIFLRKTKYRIQDFDNIHKKKIRFFFSFIILFLILGSLLLFLDKQDSEISISFENQAQEGFKVRLTSREEFLKKYNNPKLNFLPQSDMLSASISGFLKNDSADALLPARNWLVQFKDIDAMSALAIYVPEKRILYGRDVFTTRPIASLTKLMTALTVLDEYDLNNIITVTHEAILEEGDSARLVAGEQFRVEQLLYALLLESSNDAASAFRLHYEKNNPERSFVNVMNSRAKNMGLQDTVFVEPSGLSDGNVSTAYEVSLILHAAFQNEAIAKIMASSSYTTQSINKDITHFWVNLNPLLGSEEGLLGGKTGFTNEAGPSMATISLSPIKNNFIVSVVLDAQDRIEATRQLLSWVKEAYIWE